MKKIKYLVVAVFACFLSANAQNIELKSEIDSLSYILGMNIGVGMQQQIQSLPGEKVNMDLFINALSKALRGEELLVKSNEEAMAFLQEYFAKIEAAENAAQAERAQENKKAGEEFLAKNKKRKGVTTTASGLQYEIITKGTGRKPTAEDDVKVHYRGMFIDGTEFDSSFARNEPAVFRLNQVISGWTEALQLMPAGSKWKIYLPYSLGYGEHAMASIPAFSTLIFEVELLEVMSK